MLFTLLTLCTVLTLLCTFVRQLGARAQTQRPVHQDKQARVMLQQILITIAVHARPYYTKPMELECWARPRDKHKQGKHSRQPRSNHAPTQERCSDFGSGGCIGTSLSSSAGVFGVGWGSLPLLSGGSVVGWEKGSVRARDTVRSFSGRPDGRLERQQIDGQVGADHFSKLRISGVRESARSQSPRSRSRRNSNPPGSPSGHARTLSTSRSR